MAIATAAATAYGIQSRCVLSVMRPWDSTSAKWRTGAGKLPRRKRLPAARPRSQSLSSRAPNRGVERAARMPMLFSPTIGAAITAG